MTRFHIDHQPNNITTMEQTIIATPNTTTGHSNRLCVPRNIPPIKLPVLLEARGKASSHHSLVYSSDAGAQSLATTTTSLSVHYNAQSIENFNHSSKTTRCAPSRAGFVLWGGLGGILPTLGPLSLFHFSLLGCVDCGCERRRSVSHAWESSTGCRNRSNVWGWRG